MTPGRRATMVFGDTSKTESAPLEQERRACDEIPAEVLGTL